MPVKEKVNKSEEIRKLHASGLQSGSEIFAKLKARGIKVTPAQVYTVLATHRQKGKKKKSTKGRRSAPPTSGNETIVDHAVVFVRSAGGMEKAKEILSKLSLLQS